MKVVPSIIPYEREQTEKEVSLVCGFADRIQVDVCDGNFAGPTTWPWNGEHGDLVLPEYKYFEIHMMANFPEEKIKDLIGFKPKMIIAQIEAEGNFQKFINVCKQNQIEIGISIMPKTDISVLESFVPQADYLQCMGSNQIGHHGVGLENSAVEKIKILKAIYPESVIGIDIGVNLENKDILQKAGADVLVVGSAILNAENPAEVYEQLKK